MKRIGLESVTYYLSPLDSPKATVDPGEEIVMELYDAYAGQIQSPADLRTALDFTRLTPVIGPIGVRGALPGDSIVITVKDISVGAQGVMVTAAGLGVLGNLVDKPNTKILPVRSGQVVFPGSPSLLLDAHPMIGTIGVAPSTEPVRSYTPGDYGGNMDIKDIGAGAQVYLPVLVPGALLYAGDLHALQGDGELDGTGVEIAGEVRLLVELRKSHPIPRPRILTEHFLLLVASARTLDRAIEIAVQDMVGYLSDSLSLSFDDAYRLVSAVVDIRIAQVVNPRVTVMACLPRRLSDSVVVL